MMALRDRRSRLFGKTLGLGLVVGMLYAALFLSEGDILAWTAQGRWTFVVPLAIAFLFSLAHGAFTHNFWELVGIRAKTATGGK
jgi:hypothetical protein